VSLSVSCGFSQPESLDQGWGLQRLCSEVPSPEWANGFVFEGCRVTVLMV
jgi:hypothetical protein